MSMTRTTSTAWTDNKLLQESNLTLVATRQGIHQMFVYIDDKYVQYLSSGTLMRKTVQMFVSPHLSGTIVAQEIIKFAECTTRNKVCE